MTDWHLYVSAWRMADTISPAGTFTYGYAPNSASSLIRTTALLNLALITIHFDTLERLDYSALENKWGHVLDGYAYAHDPMGLRTNITRDFGLSLSTVNAGYDNLGQLTSWSGKEQDGSLRWNEQLGWNYDAANNLNFRTNADLVQTFTVDPANELTNIICAGTLTLTGNTPAPATNVTVNGLAADRYADFTFARTNLALGDGVNSFTNVANNAYVGIVVGRLMMMARFIGSATAMTGHIIGTGQLRMTALFQTIEYRRR